MTQTIRIFISSPGDVRDAREVAAQTIQKVAQDYLRYFRLEAYMWETEALLASGHFQDAIEPPSDFDIVALIVWSRLGTPLPEQTAVRRYEGIDGRTPVTGTEWEYEDALKAARARQTPDILVYRSRRPANIDTWDAAQRDEQLEQLRQLDAFWSRHFADGRAFIGAYHEFGDLGALAGVFEAHLRQLLDRRVQAQRSGAPSGGRRIWTHAPFNGLVSYSYDQAEIFFGRAEATGKAIAQLADNAEKGCAFLLALGASGSGKSSLLKAGLAPGLSIARRVTGKSFRRRAYFRPGDRVGSEGLIEAFARAVTTVSRDQPGLAEIGDLSKFARNLREAPARAHAHFESALDRVTTEGRASGAVLPFEEAVLLVIIDQLEEMFTDANIPAVDRSAFVELLAGLAHGGRVWIVAGMRSDFWHRAQEFPELIAIAEGFGRIDILPPRPAEISQMIRLPAEAAGLAFERHPVSGVALNEQIAEDASGAPGVLPLLSYVMEQIYRRDCLEADGQALSFATYENLGGLKGAIAGRAEVVLASLEPEVQVSLPKVLVSLVQGSRDDQGSETFTARRCGLDSFEPGSPARRLIEAFLAPDARLFLAENADGKAPVVRIAHEALIFEWHRARECLTQNALLLQIRSMVESRYRRAAQTPGSKTGLLVGDDLLEAGRLLRSETIQPSAELTDFIRRSWVADLRTRRRKLVIATSVAVAMSVFAVAAVAMAFQAFRSAADARMDLQHLEFINIERDGDTALHNKKFAVAASDYSQDVGLGRRLTAYSPGDYQLQYNLARAHASLAFALLRLDPKHDRGRARQEFKAAVQLANKLASSEAAPADIRSQAQGLVAKAASLMPSDQPPRLQK